MDDSIQLQLSPKGLCDRGSIAYQNVELFNFGQGFISFGIFGLDKHLDILPFKRRCHCRHSICGHHYNEKVCDGEMGERESHALGTMFQADHLESL